MMWHFLGDNFSPIKKKYALISELIVKENIILIFCRYLCVESDIHQKLL